MPDTLTREVPVAAARMAGKALNLIFQLKALFF